MPNWFDRIASSLKSNNKPTRVLKGKDGRLLFSPFASRIVGCDIAGVSENVFWHDPKVEDAAEAGQSLELGFGGDRFWLAPEIGFRWPDLARARANVWDGVFTPAQMDPGDWRVAEERDDLVRTTAEMKMHDYRVKKNVAVRVSRQVALSSLPDGLPSGLRSVSFSINNTVTLLEGDKGAVIGGWDILQVRSGGTLICPTVSPIDRPRQYYGEFDPVRTKIDERAVRFTLDGKNQLKIGLSAMQTTGRMGYFHAEAGGKAWLIFRAFDTLPGEPYVDVPLTSDELLGGDALQSYNDNGQFGGFGEMEYQEPGLIVGQGPTTRSTSSVTHVLSGDDAAVREAGRVLLGVGV